MCNIIAIANQKGGAGKTTTTKNFGYALCQMGKKVLLVDFDPQYSLTTCLGLDAADEDVYNIATLMELVMNGKEAGALSEKESYIKTIDGVDLIPGNLTLSSMEMLLVGALDREYVLKTILDEWKAEYDYILIDCNPSLGILVLNALAASDKVLIPVDSNFLSSKGFELFLGTIFRVKKRINRELRIAGILLTKYNKQTNLSKNALKNLEEAYGEYVSIFKTMIPSSVRVGESDEAGKSILDYAPLNPVANAYLEFAKEALAYE